jgi:hypothetical protein
MELSDWGFVIFRYSNAKPMNMWGWTSTIPQPEKTVKLHEGNGTLAGSLAATQKGRRPAT